MAENKTVNLDTLVKNRGLAETSREDVSVLDAPQGGEGEDFNQGAGENEIETGNEENQEQEQTQEQEQQETQQGEENQEQRGQEQEDPNDPYADIPYENTEAYKQDEDVELDLSDLTIDQNGVEIPISNIIEERNDLLARVQEIEKDPFLKGFLEFYKNGGDVTQYIENKSVKYDTMGDMDVLKHVFDKENSDLNAPTRERLFKREMTKKYGFDLDSISEEDAASEDFKIAQELIKRDAFRSREALKTQQQKFSIPERKQAVDPQVQREAIQKQVMNTKEVRDFLNNKLVRIDVPDEQGNYFAFVEKNPEKVVEMIVDGNKFWNVLLDKDGKVDWNKAHKVLSYATDPAAYERELIKLGRRQGQRDKIIQDRNIDGRLNQQFEAQGQEEKPFLTGLAEAFRAKARQKK